MHSSRRLLATSLLLAATVVAAPFARAASDGVFDFGKFQAAPHGNFVDINLSRGVLKLASVVARFDDASTAGLLASISQVRVNVVGLDETNRDATTARLQAIRANLVRDGWERVVAAQGQDEEDVAIFLKQREGEVIDGVVVTVLDARKHEAVFINVVGQIRPEQIGAVGEHLKIKHLARGVRVRHD